MQSSPGNDFFNENDWYKGLHTLVSVAMSNFIRDHMYFWRILKFLSQTIKKKVNK